MATRETAHDLDTSTAASRPSHPNDVVWRSGSRAVHGRRLRLVATLVSAIVASTAGLWSTSHIAAADVGTWCNNDPITVPDSGAASPYPSTVTVSDAGMFAGTVTVELTGVSHSYPGDLDILLVSPTGQSLVLMSDASDQYTNSAATTLTFSDSAAGPIPFDSILTSGTYLPTNVVRPTTTRGQRRRPRRRTPPRWRPLSTTTPTVTGTCSSWMGRATMPARSAAGA